MIFYNVNTEESFFLKFQLICYMNVKNHHIVVSP